MIITTLLGLTSALTGNKKAKIAILSLEIAILTYTLLQQKDEKNTKKLNS